MPKRNYWLIFLCVQIAGALLPKLGHSMKPLLYTGLILLIPGDLLASVTGKISPFLFYPLVFVINGAAWFLIGKIFLREAYAESGPESAQR